MTDAAVGAAGLAAVVGTSAGAAVSVAGMLGVARTDTAAAVAAAGVLGVTRDQAKAGVARTGLLALVKYKQPYAVAQMGLLGVTVSQAKAALSQAGAVAVTINQSEAAIAGAGLLALVRFVPPPGPAPVVAPSRTPGTPIDVKLVYDSANHCCDIVFNGTDFALDETPASAMLMSLLAKKRAKPDAVLPTPVQDWKRPQNFNVRGGYPGDALDPNGKLVGSWLWLYERSLADEETYNNVQAAVVDAVGWLESVRGLALQVALEWIAAEILAYRVRAGDTILELKQAFNS